MTWKALLTINLHRSITLHSQNWCWVLPVDFCWPAASSTNTEHSVCRRSSRKTIGRLNLHKWTVEIVTAKYVLVSRFFKINTPFHLSSDEKGIQSMAGKTREDLRWQIKCLGLSMRLLRTLRYTQGIII